MGRPVKSGLLHQIYITAKTTPGGSVSKVSGGYSTGVKEWSNGIIKQETSRGYYVQTSYGQARCRLVASDTIGYKQATILATDSDGNTYWVTKLTAHLALLTQKEQVGVPAFQFQTGKDIRWTLANAVAGKTVRIDWND